MQSVEKHDFVRGVATTAVHAGQYVDKTTGAIIPPIYVSSTYEVFSGELPVCHIFTFQKFVYGRLANPTRTVFEEALAALEKGKYCIATSSGLSAVSLVFHMLKPGDHVIAGEDLYGGSTVYLKEIAETKEGLQVSRSDFLDMKAVEALVKPNTKLVYIETPTNPTLNVLDIKAIAKVCKDKKLILVVDNTFLSPILQNPLELGADVVLHSCTKYIGGHSDIIMGAIVTSDEDIYKSLKTASIYMGTCPGPFDCFLASRGLKTLPLRVKKAQKNAMKLAEILDKHPKIGKCIYPGLAHHPGRELMLKQAKGFGSMITITLKADGAKTNAFYQALTLFGHAVSLGGVESLVSLPVMVTHKAVPKEVREKLGITDSTVRLSIGIEDFEDLRDDILTALHFV